MKGSIKLKAAVDLCMTGGLLAAMTYLLIGEQAHEWIGAGMFVLFITHNALNWKWYRNLFRGRYTPVRVLQTTSNLLVLLSMLGLMASGIILSKYVFDFLPITGLASFARTLHMLSAYWGFAFMSLHLGLHWSMILGMVRKGLLGKRTPAAGKWVLRVAALLVAGFGAFALLRHDLFSYMSLKNPFVFFDLERPLWLFFCDYAAMMGLWIWVGYYLRLLLNKASRRKEGE